MKELKGSKVWIVLVFITVVYLAVRVNIVDIPLDRDEGVFGYIGQVIKSHGIPYRDAFDHKPPVVFYIYAVALLFVPPTASGIHIFLHAYNFITLICLFFTAKKLSGSVVTASWAALAYAMISSCHVLEGFSASTEMFMLLPIVLSLLLATLFLERRNKWYLVASGVSGAIACWTKQTAFFSVLFVLGYLIVEEIVRSRREGITPSPGPILLWIAGAVSVSLSICGYFFAVGAFREFMYWSFSHNFLYTGTITQSQRLAAVLGKIGEVLKLNLVPAAIGIGYGVWRALKRDRIGWYLVAFLLLSFIGTVPGMCYGHYFAQLAPPLALASGFGFCYLQSRVAPGALKGGAVAVLALLLVGVPVLAAPDYYYSESPDAVGSATIGYPFSEARVVAKYLCDHTAPCDCVLVFGSEPEIPFYASRKSATSFAMLYPLLSVAYPRYREFQSRALQEIARNNPKYVVYVDIYQSLMWDGKANPEFIERTAAKIRSEYALEATMLVNGEERGNLVVSPEKIPADKNVNQIRIYRRIHS